MNFLIVLSLQNLNVLANFRNLKIIFLQLAVLSQIKEEVVQWEDQLEMY